MLISKNYANRNSQSLSLIAVAQSQSQADCQFGPSDANNDEEKEPINPIIHLGKIKVFRIEKKFKQNKKK